MKYELVKNNNNKKLFIGVSIIFCIIILILGTTFAYFSQSIGNNIDSIVTTDDIANTLIYTENLAYTREGLIPAKEEIAKQAYNLEGSRKCIDDYGHSACSMYEFNIKNIANVSQELVIDMIPTVNTFTNLHIFAYEIDSEGNKKDLIELQKIEKITDVNNIPTYNITSKSTLKPNEDKTYQIVFFVLDTGEDQTAEDANKQFGAGIRINSITTGKYIVKNYGPKCWETAVDDPTTLEVFNGINHNTGKVVEMCNGYVEQDKNGYYSINVPSNIGGQEITTLGNNLFNAIESAGQSSIVFSKYQYIKEIKIDEGITEIKNGDMNKFKGAFLAIGMGISDSKYSFNITLPSTLTSIGNLTFYGSSLNSINIPSNVETIGDYAFQGNANLTTLAFEENSKLHTIGEESFSYTNISSVKIPKNVITINRKAFNSISNLKTLTFEDGSQLETIGNNAFSGSSISSLTIPKTVTSIGSNAFYNNSNLTTLTFEDGSQLQTIDSGVFSDTGISSVIIPKTVTSIGDSAFSNNSNLTTLTFEEGNQLQTIGNYAFSGSSISSLTIPKTVTSIGDYAFYNNSNLTTLIFGEGSQLNTIGESAFNSTSISSLTIPKTVTSIGVDAFSNNSNLTSLIFEDGSQLEEIKSAFSNNSNLQTLIFGKNSQLKTIGNDAFKESKISSLTIPKTVTSIGNKAFYNNSNLTTLTFEEGSQLNTIGDFAFCSTSISSLTIPKTVTSIGDSAFSNNSNLTTLIFEEGNQLQTIGEHAFSSSSISSLTILKTVTSIGDSAFYNNSNLTILTFEDGSQLNTIENHAFGSCALNYPDSANYLLLPSTITSMGTNAFAYNSNLKYIKFNGSEDGFPDNWKGNAQILKDQQ